MKPTLQLIVSSCVWSLFLLSTTLFVALFPLPDWLLTLFYSLFTLGYVFYDTILYQRFTPTRTFYLALVITQILTPTIEFGFMKAIYHRPFIHQTIDAPRIIFAVIISSVFYHIMRSWIVRPAK